MTTDTTIIQSVKFRASAGVLFDMYMNQKKHSLITGAPAKITSKVGEKFSAHDGYITGKTLFLDPPKIIVQTWRGSDWNAGDPDSILILAFKRTKGGFTQMDMIHANVPRKHRAHLNQGWKEHYWNKWKKHLERK
jgi:activator of HSP90 ATPase